jgi:hypothetical protein
VECKAASKKGRHTYPQALRREVFYKKSLKTESQEAQELKNPAAEQHSFPQGCTVRPETSAGQSSLGGV